MIQADIDSIDIKTPTSAEGHFDPCASIFGTCSDTAVKRYIQARVKKYITFTQEKYATIQPERVRYEKFKDSTTGAASKSTRNATVGVNLSSGVWFTGQVNEIPMRICLANECFDVDSLQNALIAVPDNYRNSIPECSNKRYARANQILRQGVLVHEARHADCTGGMAQATLDKARTALNRGQFLQGVDATCTHWHAPCETGNYQDLPACDNHAWGAYTMSLVYYMAARENAKTPSVENDLLKMLIKDMRSRLNFRYAAMLRGDLGAPDMSHSEAIADKKTGSVQ